MKKIISRAAGLVFSLALVGQAQATDLLQAWQAALAHDPEIKAAASALQAGEARQDQADSLWRPNIGLRAALGAGGAQNRTTGAYFSAPAMGAMSGATFETKIDHGTTSAYGLELQQPILDLQRSAQSKELQHAAALAQASWQGARQQAALRLAQRYFDVLSSQHRQKVLLLQEKTIAQMLQQAQARHRAGDSPVLDVHEAKARLGAVQAQRLQADTDLAVARSAFAESTGLNAAGLEILRPSINLPSAGLESIDFWLAKLDSASPELMQSIQAAAMAYERAQSLRASAQPKITLIGAASRNRLSGNDSHGHASIDGSQWAVGLELRIPLYTGGMRSAQLREALANHASSQHQTEAIRQEARRMAQAAWLQTKDAPARIAALEQALAASELRLQATHLGLEVGERTQIDLLDAERDAAAASLDLHQTQISALYTLMSLHALAGELDDALIAQINQNLQ